MPHFVVTIEYIKPMDVVEAHTPAHREFSAGLAKQGLLLASGPFNPRTGGMLILKADSEAAVMKTLEADPFKQLAIAKYTVREWVPKVGADRLG